MLPEKIMVQIQIAVANKNIMVGILLAGKALLKSRYVKRYSAKGIFCISSIF